MVELAQHLLEHRDMAHGPVRLVFTCDEEIGRGPSRVDSAQVGATVCYTLDGGGQDEIDVETFSADLAVVTVQGVNIHPSIAKGKMVNAVRIAGALLARLPRELSPERTADRDGFLHPYQIEGGVAKVELKILLRSFVTEQLAVYAEQLRTVATEIAAGFPGSRIDVDIRRQYRNMADGLRREPRAVQYAVDAHRRLGREPKLTSIRGGTDGVAVHRTRLARAEPFVRPAQYPLAARIRQPRSNGRGARSRGRNRQTLGGVKWIGHGGGGLATESTEVTTQDEE